LGALRRSWLGFLGNALVHSGGSGRCAFWLRHLLGAYCSAVALLFLPTFTGCVGMSSRQPSPFSLLRQRKGTKRKATLLAGRPRADCSALLGLWGSRRTRYALCERCAQTAARSQKTKHAARAAPKPCAARRLTKGTQEKARLRPRVTPRSRGERDQRQAALPGTPAPAGMACPDPRTSRFSPFISAQCPPQASRTIALSRS
jgi:hypothetical protein